MHANYVKLCRSNCIKNRMLECLFCICCLRYPDNMCIVLGSWCVFPIFWRPFSLRDNISTGCIIFLHIHIGKNQVIILPQIKT